MSAPLIAGTVPFFARRSMAACAQQERLILFGGVGGDGSESILDVSGDCWMFDTRQLEWHELRPRGGAPWPSARRCCGVVGSDVGMYLCGGSGIKGSRREARYTFLNDLWHLDAGTFTWRLVEESEDHTRTPESGSGRLHRPPPRYAPVLESTSRGLFLFGGYTEDRLGKRMLNDVWMRRGDQWNEVPRTRNSGYGVGARWPSVRYGSMAATQDDLVYVFGGYSEEGDHNDLWCFDPREERWTLMSPGGEGREVPAARYCGALASWRGCLYLFGGRSRRHPKRNYNDLWRLELGSGRWNQLEPSRQPHRYSSDAEFPAYHAKSATAVVGERWYLLGGEGLRGHVSDFWRYDFSRHWWEQIQPARRDDPIFW